MTARAATRSRHGFPAGEAGFTLIEMLVVLTIIGLLAAIALTRLGARPAFVDRAQLYIGLVATIAQARQRAADDGEPVRVDLTRLDIPRLVYVPAFATNADALIVFPDGSTNGGSVSTGKGSAVAISWMTGQVSDAPH